VYKGKHVVYSLRNFVFGETQPASIESMIFQARQETDGIVTGAAPDHSGALRRQTQTTSDRCSWTAMAVRIHKNIDAYSALLPNQCRPLEARGNATAPAAVRTTSHEAAPATRARPRH
jgi:hypothetical protein